MRFLTTSLGQLLQVSSPLLTMSSQRFHAGRSKSSLVLQVSSVHRCKVWAKRCLLVAHSPKACKRVSAHLSRDVLVSTVIRGSPCTTRLTTQHCLQRQRSQHLSESSKWEKLFVAAWVLTECMTQRRLMCGSSIRCKSSLTSVMQWPTCLSQASRVVKCAVQSALDSPMLRWLTCGMQMRWMFVRTVNHLV